MKNILLILLWGTFPFMSRAQEQTVDLLFQRIDSLYESCRQQKEKNKLSCYELALELHDSIYNMMLDSVEYFASFETDARAYKFFANEGISVFSDGFLEINTDRLPKYMAEHYMAIKAIRQYMLCIESMERKIQDAESDSDIAEDDRKKYVAMKIRTEIDKANDFLDRIDSANLTSLSETQEKFYLGLTEKLNNILTKYIFEQ